MLAVAVLAAAFWILALGPKRQEASDLGKEVEQQQASLAQAQSAASEALAAREEFPHDYRQLVLLGKAVPGSDDTASLLVEVSHVAEQSGVRFQSIELSATSSTAGEATTTTVTPAPTATGSGSVPPTEAAAALLPLGATIGSAGLGVMPYTLTFSGEFFQVADFIQGIDSMVDVDESKVAVDGRLITLDGFALNSATEGGFPNLDANFSVTTYLVPPGQGLTAGASPTAPAPAESTTSAAR
jgi:Tfp pilus assembly protein PilO